MPTLTPILYYFDAKPEKLTEPLVWYCSDCKQLFSLDKWLPNPSSTQLHRVDAQFRIHCKESHSADKHVVGLTIPNPKEDMSQAAARIVREATKD